MKIDNKSLGNLKPSDSSKARSPERSSRSSFLYPSVPKDIKSLLTSQFSRLENSLKLLNIQKDHSLEKALPPLKQILNLLNPVSFQFSGNESDLMLMERFLISWMKKYGDDIPGGVRKELSGLINIVKSLNISDPGVNDNPLYIMNSEIAGERNSWRLSFTKDRKADPEDADVPVSCSLEMETENLGALNIVLSHSDKGGECLFLCDRERTRSLIRENMETFRKQLEDHGLIIPLTKVGRSVSGRKKNGNAAEKKEVDLWG